LANSDVIEQERKTYRVTLDHDGEGGYHIQATPMPCRRRSRRRTLARHRKRFVGLYSQGLGTSIGSDPDQPYWFEITCLNLSQIQAMLRTIGPPWQVGGVRAGKDEFKEKEL
jgi:hypothetical protein